MIDKATALETLLERAATLPVGHCLDVRTYKRNRGLLLRRIDADTLEIFESGYEDRLHVAANDDLRRLLKTLLKREFPRSTKIRLYTLGACDPDKATGRGLKKL